MLPLSLYFLIISLYITRWFFNLVGDSRCPISDTWWQTETGGFMVDMFVLFDYILFAETTILLATGFTSITLQITPLPGAWPQKPGSATFPFFGVQVLECRFILYDTLMIKRYIYTYIYAYMHKYVKIYINICIYIRCAAYRYLHYLYMYMHIK